jgi:predicted RecB family nuclease
VNQLPIWGAAPRTRPSIKPLSKSRVAAGLQCHKRLYFECYHYNDREKPDDARKALMESGQEVGRVARGRYPGGVEIVQDHFHLDEAEAATRTAMKNAKCPAVYEAALSHDDIRIRVDILARSGRGAWDLIEVKSSGSVKEEHLPDLAVQLLVAEGAGVPISRAGILHINKTYVWPGGPYDLEALFHFEDLTSAARALRDSLRHEIDEMRAPLWSLEPPDVPIGSQCDTPYRCPFYPTCHSEPVSDHPIASLPRLTARLRRAFEEAGIEDIREIPEEFEGLSDLQRRVRACVLAQAHYVSPDLGEKLAAARFPIHFLDFETCNPALPLIPGTRPFQQTPFQWSDHVLEKGGALHHREYLHVDRTDPRRALAESLLEALGEEGTIVVYSDFEERMIRELAEAIPEISERLARLQPRILDLHKVIHTHYYHPGFNGSFSIKQVLPVVVPELSYDGLEIREGSQAALAFIDMTDPGQPRERRERLRDGLLRYCRRDTEAMVRLYQTLREIE